MQFTGVIPFTAREQSKLRGDADEALRQAAGAIKKLNAEWNDSTKGFLGLGKLRYPNQERYIEYFGTITTDRLTHVRNGYAAVQSALQSRTINFNNCPHLPTCARGAALYVFLGGDIEIFVCPVYWKFREESRGMMVLHEITHEAHGTGDKHNGHDVYGDAAVRALAKQNPAGATTIADNYAWFSKGMR